MPEGRVIKAYSGHYFVKHEDGIVHCSLRGKFRKEDKNVLVGDIVSFKITDSKGLYGVIEDILPRKTYLTRPPVANVDQVVVVIACQEPPPNIELLDRILVAVEADCLDIVICFNKIDLVSRYAVDKLAKPYRNANYEIIKTSARAGWGITKLRKALSGNLSVFAGPSGAGKSALLNALEPGLRLKTGEVSERTGHGRHTTRYAHLLQIGPTGYVADTPGFSRLDLNRVDSRSLGFLFPEFRIPMNNCRFTTCVHYKEPGCGVKEAMETGLIPQLRYDNYIKILLEIMEREGRGNRQ